MAVDVSKYTTPIKTAVMAREVRDNIADGIDAIASEVNTYEETLSADNDQFKEDITTKEKAHSDAENARVVAENVRQTNEENRQVAESGRVAAESNRETAFSGMTHVDANLEISSARNSNITGKQYDTVGHRMDNVDSQLAEKANAEDLYKRFNYKYKNAVDTVHGLLHRTSIIGDSISHGAGSLDSPNNSWAGILRKMLQIEYNTKNYGYVNLGLPEAVHGSFDVDAISVTQNGTWTEKNPNGSYPGAYAIESSTSGDSLTITVLRESKLLGIFYEIATDGGLIDISLNDVVVVSNYDTKVGTVATYGLTTLIDTSSYVAPFTLKITKKDNGRTDFSGIELLDDSSMPILDNYSKSGSALVDYTDDILNRELDSNVVFFALGYNDRYGRNDINGFTAKITTVINKLKSNGAFCVVLDFLWYLPIADVFRQQLLRLHQSLPNSIYIPFPDLVIFTNSQEAIDSGFSKDGTHMQPLGHQMVGEFIAKMLGLGVTSKKLAEKILVQDEAIADIAPLNGWVKRGPNCQVIKNNNTISIFFSLKSGTTSNGTEIFDIPNWAIPGESGVIDFQVLVTDGTNFTNGTCYIGNNKCKIGGGVTANAGIIGNVTYSIN